MLRQTCAHARRQARTRPRPRTTRRSARGRRTVRPAVRPPVRPARPGGGEAPAVLRPAAAARRTSPPPASSTTGTSAAWTCWPTATPTPPSSCCTHTSEHGARVAHGARGPGPGAVRRRHVRRGPRQLRVDHRASTRPTTTRSSGSAWPRPSSVTSPRRSSTWRWRRPCAPTSPTTPPRCAARGPRSPRPGAEPGERPARQGAGRLRRGRWPTPYDVALYDLDGVLYLAGEPGAARRGERGGRARARAARRVRHQQRLAPSRRGRRAPHRRWASRRTRTTSSPARRPPPGGCAEHLPAGQRRCSCSAPTASPTRSRRSGLRPVRQRGRAAGGRRAGPGPGHRLGATSPRRLVALRAGALWVAGNSDSTYPSPRGPLPGNGAIVAALATASGQQPVVVGKPEPALHRESVERVGAPAAAGGRRPARHRRARRGARRVRQPARAHRRRRRSTSCSPRRRACGRRTSSADLRGLLVPHAPVVLDGRRRALRRRAGATWQGGELVLTGEGDEALRAACALSWARVDTA